MSHNIIDNVISYYSEYKKDNMWNPNILGPIVSNMEKHFRQNQIKM